MLQVAKLLFMSLKFTYLYFTGVALIEAAFDFYFIASSQQIHNKCGFFFSFLYFF